MKIRPGKLFWKIAAVLVIVGVIGTVFLSRRDNTAQKAVEETRQALRQQGFKTDLTEFDFSTSAELRAREAALTNADIAGAGLRGADYARRYVLFQDDPSLMTAVGSDSAVVVCKQNKFETYYSKDVWQALREAIDPDRALLDAACEAALSGPIGFNLNASHGNYMLLRHCGLLKNLTQTLGRRAVLQLHDGNNDAAWTNVLAATRLVTAWEPEPAEVSHLVRFACATIAYNIAWQALQAGDWSDDRLARLQHEWESADFFRNLPETAAFQRASCVADCQRSRQEHLEPSPTLTDFFKEALRSPFLIWSELNYRWKQASYHKYGSYEDEKALLLFYRGREIEIRNAVQAPTWSAMRQLPGVTKVIPFQSKYYSRMQAMLHSHEISMAFQRQGAGLLGRAAETEVRRRLIITAIALERYRGKHGSYPNALADLAPEFLRTAPIDFMDGQPLRYRLADDGHFLLYSVGLDCVDNGGQMPSHEQQRMPDFGSRGFGAPPKGDLVWPRPASSAEAAAQHGQELKAQEERTAQIHEREAADEKRAESLRQAAVKRLLAMKPVPKSKEPTYQGKPLSNVLRNEKASGTNKLTLDELLSVKQIITGEEPDMATFEIPISYDAVTNIGVLHLLIDAGGLEPTDSVWIASSPEVRAYDGGGELQECSRATNGNCLLAWNTTYDPPGQHALQAQLLCTDRQKGWHTFEIRGPVAPFFSSNICQFDPFYSEFDSSGAILHAKLPEQNGIYTIEIKSPTGEHIKTLAGTTSNGVIDVKWDLKDDHGNKCTNDSIKAVFHITLPDSGRTQTLRGP